MGDTVSGSRLSSVVIMLCMSIGKMHSAAAPARDSATNVASYVSSACPNHNGVAPAMASSLTAAYSS